MPTRSSAGSSAKPAQRRVDPPPALDVRAQGVPVHGDRPSPRGSCPGTGARRPWARRPPRTVMRARPGTLFGFFGTGPLPRAAASRRRGPQRRAPRAPFRLDAQHLLGLLPLSPVADAEAGPVEGQHVVLPPESSTSHRSPSSSTRWPSMSRGRRGGVSAPPGLLGEHEEPRVPAEHGKGRRDGPAVPCASWTPPRRRRPRAVSGSSSRGRPGLHEQAHLHRRVRWPVVLDHPVLVEDVAQAPSAPSRPVLHTKRMNASASSTRRYRAAEISLPGLSAMETRRAGSTAPAPAPPPRRGRVPRPGRRAPRHRSDGSASTWPAGSPANTTRPPAAADSGRAPAWRSAP